MSQAKPRGGSSVVLAVISMILLLLALYTLQQGIDAFQAGQLELGILYLTVMLFSFGIVALSILRVRRGYSFPYLAPSKVLSIVRCAQCSFKQIKNFAAGDYVFKVEGKCTQCGNESLFINGIYAEDLRKR